MNEVSKTCNEFFREMQNEDFCERLNAFLNKEYSEYTCYPPRELLFNAFRLTPLDKVRVVIVGQDPYHEPGQAMGLSFSVPRGIKVPPSLVNIYKVPFVYFCFYFQYSGRWVIEDPAVVYVGECFAYVFL